METKPHPKEELSCTFAIAAQRGYSPIRQEEIEALPPALQRFLKKHHSGAGCTMIELTGPQGEKNSYYHDLQGVWFFASKAGTKAGATQIVPSAFGYVMNAVGLAAVGTLVKLGCAPLGMLLCMGGLGTVRKHDGRANNYHDRLEKDVTPEKYEEIKAWLDKRAGATQYYNLVANNCSHIAVKAAKIAGVKSLGNFGFNCPDLVAGKIRKMARIDGVYEEGVRAYSLRDRAINGDFAATLS